MKSCLLVIGLLHVLGTNCISIKHELNNFTEYLLLPHSEHAVYVIKVFGKEHNCIFRANPSIGTEQLDILIFSELEQKIENLLKTLPVNVLKKIRIELVKYLLIPRTTKGVDMIKNLLNRTDCYFTKVTAELQSEIPVLIPTSVIADIENTSKYGDVLVEMINDFSNSITYFVTPRDNNAVKALYNFEAKTISIIRNIFYIGKETEVTIKLKQNRNFKQILTSFNITHFTVLRPSIKETVDFDVKAKTRASMEFLQTLAKKDYCVFEKTPRYYNQNYFVSIHPTFKSRFQNMLTNHGIEYEGYRYLPQFNNETIDSTLYIVIPKDFAALNYVKKIKTQKFITFLNKPLASNKIVFLMVDTPFKSSFERALKRQNVQYFPDINLYRQPDFRQFCEYKISPNDYTSLKDLQLLVNHSSCTKDKQFVTKRMPRIITIHPEFRDVFEELLKHIDTEYQLINWMPKKPNDYNYCKYVVMPKNSTQLQVLIEYSVKCGCFKINKKINSVGFNMRIKIHPEYKTEFELLLRTCGIKFSLTDQKPEIFDCNRFNYYIVKPQTNEAYAALKKFIYETDLRYWKSQWPENQQIEVMISKEFGMNFEELMNTLRIECKLLNMNE